MASNSKKRRRVLRVSCILAALIIAGSSFAWFTSKDEVTNRLTASADYNVSIIENFAPPKQWVPGQTVTKEEAVVNTGNVDAFVKQTISGVAKIKVDVPTMTEPDGTDAYVELNAKEYGTLEAGSYLAWVPTGSSHKLGEKVVYAITNSDDNEENNVTDFTPDADGLYIFRRAITTDNTMTDTAYEYVGYYFKNGKYYKLYSIDKDSLSLAKDKDGNVLDGNLDAAPTVKYAKTVETVLNKAPMTYEAAAAASGDPGDDDYVPAHGDRLVLTYNTNANPDTTALDKETYAAYRAYLDAKTGKTKWEKGLTTDPYDTANVTGLTTYDIYDQDAVVEDNNKVARNDLVNWSLDRLNYGRDDATNGTKKALTDATATPWQTLYNNAAESRDKVNAGQDAALKLSTLKTSIINRIGADKLIQDTNSPYHYSADAADSTYVPQTTDNTNTKTYVDLTTLTAIVSTIGTPDTTMTVDNLDEQRFADKAFASTNNGENQFGTAITFTTVTNPYSGTPSEGALASAWDNYVLQTQRLELVNKKIELVTAGITTNSVTNVGRNGIEANAYLLTLNNQKTAIEADLAAAKSTYEGLQSTLAADIETLNGYQDKVNTANNEYTAEQRTTQVADNPSEVVGGGVTDSVAEDALESQLINVYGVALKDTEPASYNKNTTTNNWEYTSGAKYKNGANPTFNQATYSETVTKKTIDDNLSNTDGVIGWNDPTVPATLDKEAIEAKPYFKDEKMRYMQEKRKNDVDALEATYNGQVASQGETNVNVGPIKVYVNLDNIGTGDVAYKWQYIPEAAVEPGKDFNFYYTGILESGETSSLLVKSVEFDEGVTQDMFRQFDLDLNIAAESAQVVYDGDIVKAEAANNSITGAKTTLDTYAVTDAVKWEKNTDARTNTITDKDPNPKADANVTP